MFGKMTRVILNGREYPIKCDNVVLQLIQDKYGSYEEYEKKVYNFVYDLDEDGNRVTNEQGLYTGKVEAPDQKAINDGLYWMVQEGLDIEADEAGIEAEQLDYMRFLRSVDTSPYVIGEVLQKELVKAFERKNIIAPETSPKSSTRTRKQTK